jgi:hypothetical protein
MERTRKSLSVSILIILVLLNLITVQTISAQSRPKPSSPEFTVELVDHSYDVPSTTKSTTNFYTNVTKTVTIPGYHVHNLTIELSIRNQPYPATIDGNKTSLAYDLEIKPHFAQNWTTASPMSVSSTKAPANGSGFRVAYFSAYYNIGDQIDFRARARLMYEHTVYEYDIGNAFYGVAPGYYPYNITSTYETSEWSPAHTFTMPSLSTSNPVLFYLSIDALLKITLVIAIIAVLISVISILLYKRHQLADLRNVSLKPVRQSNSQRQNL